MSTSILIIGTKEYAIKRVIRRMQYLMCGHDDNCLVCQQIEARSYHGLHWLTPKKNNYTLADLASLQELVALQKDTDNPQFMVIEEAERLSAQCANSLLKLLEEPPVATTFFLLASSTKELLPTIVSRCIIDDLDTPSRPLYENLLAALMQPKLSLYEFTKLLEQELPAEHETVAILEKLIQAVKEDRRELAHKLMVYYNYLPMPGSAKYFWRKVFLSCKQSIF